MLCVANLSRLAQHVELDLATYAGAVPVEVFGRTRFAPIGELPYSLTLGPYGFFWLELRPRPSRPTPNADTAPSSMRRDPRGPCRRWAAPRR